MPDFEPRDPDYQRVVRRIFEDAPFVSLLGARLDAISPGRCVASLALKPELCQQDGFVHAGVQATLADHTAGTAASSLMGPDQRILTIEFKINLLRAAKGARLVCRGEVIRPGRTITVAESQVFVADATGLETLVAKALVTLALLDQA